MSTSKNTPWFLSKEKKSRSNFWKSRSSGYSSSNYWLVEGFDLREEAILLLQ